MISNPISNVNFQPDTCQNVLSQFHGRKVAYRDQIGIDYRFFIVIYLLCSTWKPCFPFLRKSPDSGSRRYRILQIIALGRAGNQGRTELFRMKLVQLLAEKKRLEILIKTSTHLIFPELRIGDFFCVFLRYRMVMNCVF